MPPPTPEVPPKKYAPVSLYTGSSKTLLLLQKLSEGSSEAASPDLKRGAFCRVHGHRWQKEEGGADKTGEREVKGDGDRQGDDEDEGTAEKKEETRTLLLRAVWSTPSNLDVELPSKTEETGESIMSRALQIHLQSQKQKQAEKTRGGEGVEGSSQSPPSCLWGDGPEGTVRTLREYADRHGLMWSMPECDEIEELQKGADGLFLYLCRYSNDSLSGKQEGQSKGGTKETEGTSSCRVWVRVDELGDGKNAQKALALHTKLKIPPPLQVTQIIDTHQLLGRRVEHLKYVVVLPEDPRRRQWRKRVTKRDRMTLRLSGETTRFVEMESIPHLHREIQSFHDLNPLFPRPREIKDMRVSKVLAVRRRPDAAPSGSAKGGGEGEKEKEGSKGKAKGAAGSTAISPVVLSDKSRLRGGRGEETGDDVEDIRSVDSADFWSLCKAQEGRVEERKRVQGDEVGEMSDSQERELEDWREGVLEVLVRWDSGLPRGHLSWEAVESLKGLCAREELEDFFFVRQRRTVLPPEAMNFPFDEDTFDPRTEDAIRQREAERERGGGAKPPQKEKAKENKDRRASVVVEEHMMDDDSAPLVPPVQPAVPKGRREKGARGKGKGNSTTLPDETAAAALGAAADRKGFCHLLPECPPVFPSGKMQILREREEEKEAWRGEVEGEEVDDISLQGDADREEEGDEEAFSDTDGPFVPFRYAFDDDDNSDDEDGRDGEKERVLPAEVINRRVIYQTGDVQYLIRPSPSSGRFYEPQWDYLEHLVSVPGFLKAARGFHRRERVPIPPLRVENVEFVEGEGRYTAWKKVEVRWNLDSLDQKAADFVHSNGEMCRANVLTSTHPESSSLIRRCIRQGGRGIDCPTWNHRTQMEASNSSQSTKGFPIFLQLPNGREKISRVMRRDYVRQVKKTIEDQEGYPEYVLRILFNGKQRGDSLCLGQIGVQRDSTLRVVVSGCQGGMKRSFAESQGRGEQTSEASSSSAAPPPPAAAASEAVPMQPPESPASKGRPKKKFTAYPVSITLDKTRQSFQVTTESFDSRKSASKLAESGEVFKGPDGSLYQLRSEDSPPGSPPRPSAGVVARIEAPSPYKRSLNDSVRADIEAEREKEKSDMRAVSAYFALVHQRNGGAFLGQHERGSRGKEDDEVDEEDEQELEFFGTKDGLNQRKNSLKAILSETLVYHRRVASPPTPDDLWWPPPEFEVLEVRVATPSCPLRQNYALERTLAIQKDPDGVDVSAAVQASADITLDGVEQHFGKHHPSLTAGHRYLRESVGQNEQNGGWMLLNDGEVILFHGADEATRMQICVDGLDQRKAGSENGSLFGKGFYVTPHFSKADLNAGPEAHQPLERGEDGKPVLAVVMFAVRLGALNVLLQREGRAMRGCIDWPLLLRGGRKEGGFGGGEKREQDPPG
uniref:Ubiquitin-like domain-containing protein n=1 Tax=Chromera velia CCMP2878 TaxID=1169474 RepID=A0A0G4GL99_9ALVE|eukprot:Cvel_4868.t1-p1 / transcript=Cvel_4868.t1 / gene=Cvel_4868 / organism=Chromera_velia_CCMP2878 / gene_product=hypothetical protein / transcript_product=hypothetical protein / location=Cvel_scaffold219:102029-109491(-) / protein_length=1409 / sequence_SO=supercontig / SO=protein_coding / is_pseudo=false